MHCRHINFCIVLREHVSGIDLNVTKLENRLDHAFFLIGPGKILFSLHIKLLSMETQSNHIIRNSEIIAILLFPSKPS